MKKVTLGCVVVCCVVCLVVGLVVGYGLSIAQIYAPISSSFNAVGVP